MGDTNRVARAAGAAWLVLSTGHGLTPPPLRPTVPASAVSPWELSSAVLEAPPAVEKTVLPPTWDEGACLQECAVEDGDVEAASGVDVITNLWASELSWDDDESIEAASDAAADDFFALEESGAEAADALISAVLTDPGEANYADVEAAARAAGSAAERPSWELVETFADGVPRRLGGDDFVFVNEEACNGCGMCSKIAPATFFEEATDGKGRAFEQGGDARVAIDEAIYACPRQAIHRVSFEELVRNEKARVETELVACGALEADGNAPDPLNMKCYTSPACPQKGCYNCPVWRDRGANPQYEEKEQANEARRQRALALERAAFFKSHRLVSL